jgi:N-acetylglucosaminyldiphosphoundecaprenol N-acetyl-beta-D-mannosaminyltransferase
MQDSARPAPIRRERFMGLGIDCVTMEESLRICEALIDRGGVNQHVVVNVGKVVLAQDDPGLREIINACPLINADGTGVVWGARMLGVDVPERVTGIDLFQALVARAAERGWRVYFLGARREVVARVVEIFRGRYPGLEVAGARDGYWGPEDEDELVRAIAETRPQLLFVAMPSPRKEYWLAQHLDQLGVPFAMGVGGAFDVVAGTTRRAPEWMQRAGMEWLFRLVQEPRRMWRRYLVGNSRFALMLLRERFAPRRAQR